jgi:serine/threonine-protein kinase
VKAVLLDRGFSDDIKYIVETACGERLLLRLSHEDADEDKKNEFVSMKKMAALGIPLPNPIAFGKTGAAVYSLLAWCEGEPLDDVLQDLPKTAQYGLGLQTGQILAAIHTVPAPDGIAEWSGRYFAEMDEKITQYTASGICFEGDSIMLDYIAGNRSLPKNRPQTRHHGDFHTANILVKDRKDIIILDWEAGDFDNWGDPWQEFGSLGDMPQNPWFATGVIRGYFNGEPPAEFWNLLAYYMAVSAVAYVVWAAPYGTEMLEDALQLNRDMLVWFDNMKNPVPDWYLFDILHR